MNKKIFILTTILLHCLQVIYGCDCRVNPKLNIQDWNDTGIIFTAQLDRIQKTKFDKYLTFSVSNVLKGKLKKKSIRFQIRIGPNHNILDYVDSMYIDQKWIVFASKYKKNNETIYEFKRSNDKFCRRSRPLVEWDPYLLFIDEINKYPSCKNKTYFKDTVAFAYGSMKNTKPIGLWKYYSSNDLDNYYWEGKYKNGQREGEWVRKAINYKNETVVIIKELYQCGNVTERIKYNYINEKQTHEIYDKVKNVTLIKHFYNGKLIKTSEKKLRLF